MFNDKYNFLKYNSKKFRDMYAISNQDNVPKNFLKKQFGIYPLNFGAFRIVDRLKKIILQNNLIIFSSPKNINFSISKKKIDSVTLTTNDGSVFNFNAYKIFWAQPINILVNLLKIKLIQTKAPSMQEYYYVYIVSSKSIAHNNYYIYDYDSRIFRITNYNSYVKEIPQKIKNLLCVEYANLKYEDVDSIKKNIISRLNLIDKKNKYKFLFVFKSKREPLPTIINIKKLLNIFKKINNLKINNLIITMPFFDGQSFYIHDVIKSIFKKIKNKI